MVQKVEYRLSFYEPDSERECVDFDALTPFQPVHVGDEIIGITWKDSAYPTKPEHHRAVVAVATRVVRSVSVVADTIHDITLVYSKGIDPDGHQTAEQRAHALNKL